jgi:hypothetical protein
LLKQTINISKEDVEDYNWTMFTHSMDVFKKPTSLNKLIPEYFFTRLLSDLSTKDLVMYNNLLSTKFMKPQRQLYATLGRWAWVPPKLRNKVLKLQANCQMIRPTLKPRKVYDGWKQRCVEKWRI